MVLGWSSKGIDRQGCESAPRRASMLESEVDVPYEAPIFETSALPTPATEFGALKGTADAKAGSVEEFTPLCSDVGGGTYVSKLFVANPDPDPMNETAVDESSTRPLPPLRLSSGSANVSPDFFCGACAEKVLLLNDSSLSVLEAATANHEPQLLGIELKCFEEGGGHTYCFSCITRYLQVYLSHMGWKKVFPIECPECKHVIQDEEAERILDKKELEEKWYGGKLAEEVKTFYCPLGNCGTRIEMPSPECAKSLKRTECPECRGIFCYRCQSPWHEGRTCAQYAHSSGVVALDKALEKLAKREHWRRCPKCRILIEREEGCRHMECRCGYQFCYRCGREWRKGCGQFRSIVCFPLVPDSWPETRSRFGEYVYDTLTERLRRSSF